MGATPGASNRKRQRDRDAEDHSQSHNQDAEERHSDADGKDGAAISDDRLLACPECGKPREFCPGRNCIKLWCSSSQGQCGDGEDGFFDWCSKGSCGSFACQAHAQEYNVCEHCEATYCGDCAGHCEMCEGSLCWECADECEHDCGEVLEARGELAFGEDGWDEVGDEVIDYGDYGSEDIEDEEDVSDSDRSLRYEDVL